ncbi:hypothetical protein C1645_829414 [Glomus cerebriforme]|uniref:DUF202 domain-containing protein n=1 Tax=Glomus cerebriforme TaxID=658196 RepID=A0A397SUH2_9GLOM|nr:hypothetical protein C1645_829414 [Glomus cerebriforme]
MSNEDASLLNDLITSTFEYGTFSRPFSNKLILNQLGCPDYSKNQIITISPTTLVFKNVGSTARDNLCIERNFLSWLRLSLTLILVGMAYYLRFEMIIPIIPTSRHFSLFGLFLIFFGNFVLLWALLNYFQFQHKLDKYLLVENGVLQFSIAGITGIAILMAFIIDV